MKIDVFDLERTQSIYENYVEYNLTESGVHPFKLTELLDEAEINELLNMRLTYGQTNGSVELRNAISKLYKAAGIDNVLVTNGSAEANLIAVLTCLAPGDEVVLMLPNYMQIDGMARAFGVKVKYFHLREDLEWGPDIDELKNVISPRTKMIIVCNPNNPTGAVLSRDQMEMIASLARSCGAMVYADEIYRGAELNGVEITSFFDVYDNVMVTGGLSKAYAMPGLRLGWLVGPAETIAQGWATHDYTSITAGIISNMVASLALRPERRQRILDRNRSLLRENLAALQAWTREKGELFKFVPPRAGGMAFIRYDMDINSTELCTQLREKKSVFVVAGDSFGMDRYIRIGIGSEQEYFLAGLQLISDFLKEVG